LQRHFKSIINIAKVKKTKVEIMKKNIFLFKICILYFLLITHGFTAKINYFDEGRKLFDKEEFKKSKIFFEKDIVFNPRSEKSYLYLAKIFDKNESDVEQEKNLDNVLLLNPQNDEAIYMLVLLKIRQSDYNYAKELIEKFTLVCESFCSKMAEMQEKFEKLEPENAKEKN